MDSITMIAKIINWVFMVFLALLVSCTSNRPPVAQNMVVSPVTVTAGAKANITVIATDPDGDPLAYYWSATRGYVPPGSVGSAVEYTAPETGGLDTITVVITDGKASTTSQITVSVQEAIVERVTPTSTPELPTNVEHSETLSATPTNPTPPSTPTTILPSVTSTITPSPTLTLTPTPTFTPTLTPTPDLPASMVDGQGISMVLISEGLFTMGSDPDLELARCNAFYPGGGCQLDLYLDESPIHSVMLANYYIDIYEVTNADYARCVSEGICKSPYAVSSAKRDVYYGNPQYNNYPVIHVDWNQAMTFCQWRGARLPTEAEWEKAARGIDPIPYPWGVQKPDETILNFNRRTGDTQPVGSYPQGASLYGLFDMSGNVSEWVADTYGDYPSQPQTNPTGPLFGTRKVLRGGGWQSSGEHVRVTARVWAETITGNEDYFYDVGFRCAFTP